MPLVPSPKNVLLAMLILMGTAGCQTAQNAMHGLHDDLLLASNALSRFSDALPDATRPRHVHTPNAASVAAHPRLFNRPPPENEYARAVADFKARHPGY